jgi:hypothetical protein
MKSHKSTSTKPARIGKPLRPEDFGPLRNISESDFVDICDGFGIADKKRETTKTRLEQIVREMSNWIRNDTRMLSRDFDRDRLQKMQRKITGALYELKRLGLQGKQALKSISGSFGPMLSAQWINMRFPGDDWAPRKAPIEDAIRRDRPQKLMRPDERSPKYFIEELSAPSRHQFVRNRAPQTLEALLREMEHGVTAALRALNADPAARGGRPRLRYRHYFIMNLADLWDSLGKDVSGGPGSDFAAFCEAIVEAVGWPKGGLDAALPAAIKRY